MLKQLSNILANNYSEFYDEIKNIAYDSANEEYPSKLKNKMYNFDEMAVKIYGISQDLLPCSPDALYISDKIYFIEFKNGKLDTPDKKRNLRLKFAEGPYIILAKIFKSANMRFSKQEFFSLPKVGIVIYNGRKNPSEVLNIRYGSRFQLDEYNLTLYEHIYTFTFNQFEKLVIEGKHPFKFLTETY
ncbi:MAG: hypothetical protein PHQ32_02070 [Firmicutes bacterium]|nr:hypothetical protein [Bacillota bacterium]